MVLHKVSFVLLVLTIIPSVVSFKVSYFGNYEEGRKCGTNSEGNGYFGSCLKIIDCRHAFNEYKNNQRVLQVCGFNANNNAKEDLICCSIDDLEKSKPDVSRLDVKMSLDYNECVNRYLEHRVNFPSDAFFAVHGRAAVKYDFPNMVAVGWTQNDKSVEYNCGGSIITELFIVTAAHCSSDRGYNSTRIISINLI